MNWFCFCTSAVLYMKIYLMQYTLCLLVCMVIWFLGYLFLSSPTRLAPSNAERGFWWGPQENFDWDKPQMLEVQFWIMFLRFYCSSVNIHSFFPRISSYGMSPWLWSAGDGWNLGTDFWVKVLPHTEIPLCSDDQPQIPFTCQSSQLGQGTPLPLYPSVLVWENKTLATPAAMTLGRAAQWPCVLLPNSLGMADGIICPPGVLMGGYGEAVKTNSLVDHHHLSPSVRVSVVVPGRGVRWDRPHCGLLQPHSSGQDRQRQNL